MTRKDLENLRDCKIAVKVLTEEIHKAEAHKVCDCVIGSRPAIPYDAHVIVVKGVSMERIDKLREKMERRCKDLQDMIEEVESWIDTIDDPLMQTIIRLYYRNGLTHEEIGTAVGYTRSRVTQMLSDFWTRNR